MRIVKNAKGWNVAIDGKFVATFETLAEAENYFEVPEIPTELPEDLVIDPPYERLESTSGTN